MIDEDTDTRIRRLENDTMATYDLISQVQNGVTSVNSQLVRLVQRADRVDVRFSEMQKQINARFDSTDKRILAVDARVSALAANVDERFNAVDERFNTVDERFNTVDERFNAVDERFNAVDTSLATMNTTLAVILSRLPEPAQTA